MLPVPARLKFCLALSHTSEGMAALYSGGLAPDTTCTVRAIVNAESRTATPATSRTGDWCCRFFMSFRREDRPHANTQCTPDISTDGAPILRR